MSNWHYPQLIHHRRHARNGMSPASQFWRQLVDGANHVAEFRHRPVYSRSSELGLAQPLTTSSTIARFRFRTGYNVTRVGVMLTLGASDAGGVIIQPAAYVDLTISGGATTTVGPFIAPIIESAPTDGPDELGFVQDIATVTENTVYECAVRITGYPITGSTSNEAARVLSILVYELAATGSVYVPNPPPIGGSPIYDSLRQTVLAGMSNAYRRNGGINWHWSLVDGAARTRSSATFINIIDNATTGTPTAAHQGVYLHLQYHNTTSRTTVPFQFACYASIGAGSGTVRLIDAAGNAYGSITVNGAAGWYTATANLPTAETFYAIQYAGDGVNTMSVYATSLIETE